MGLRVACLPAHMGIRSFDISKLVDKKMLFVLSRMRFIYKFNFYHLRQDFVHNKFVILLRHLKIVPNDFGLWGRKY